MEAEGMAALIAAFKVAPGVVRKALQPGIAEATSLIADQAKSNAAFSSYIPGAVSEAISFVGESVSGTVRVKERGFPHAGEARVFEGNGLSPTAFRHPAYGNREAWVSAVTHPFLGPAVLEKGPAAVAKVDATVESALQALFA